MKRRLLNIAIFLLAGAVVNVAVAWGCAAWIDLSGVSRDPWGADCEMPGTNIWQVSIYRRRGSVRIVSWWNTPNTGFTAYDPEMSAAPLVPHWAPFLSPTHEPLSDGFHTFFADSQGWPLPSMWSAVKFSIRWSDAVPTPNIAALGIVLNPGMMADVRDHRQLHLLPLRPRPLGFAGKHSVLRNGSLAVDPRSRRASQVHTHEASRMPGMCVSDGTIRCVQRVWQAAARTHGISGV